jgi:hypothetical protein
MLRLDVMHLRTVADAGIDQFARVIAARATDDYDDVATARQLDGGILTLFSRTTHRIEKPDVGLGELLSNQCDQVSHPVDGLCGLGGNTKSWTPLERLHVSLVEDDVELVEVIGQPTNLDMVALADDDRVIAVANERPDGPVRYSHKRTRRFDDLKAERAGAGEHPF